MEITPTTIDLGVVDAIVRLPEPPPISERHRIWFDTIREEQRYFDYRLNQWVLLRPDSVSSDHFETLAVDFDNEILFTLEHNCIFPELSKVSVSSLGVLMFGVDYTIGDNELTFVTNENFTLKSGDIIHIHYKR